MSWLISMDARFSAVPLFRASGRGGTDPRGQQSSHAKIFCQFGRAESRQPGWNRAVWPICRPVRDLHKGAPVEAHEIAEKIHEVDEHAHAAPDSFRKFTGVYVGFV